MTWRPRFFACALVGVLIAVGAAASAQTAVATKPAPQAVKPAPAAPAAKPAPQVVKPEPAPSAAFALAAQMAPLTMALPIDPQVTTGKFANGVRYMIRVNPKP